MRHFILISIISAKTPKINLNLHNFRHTVYYFSAYAQLLERQVIIYGKAVKVSRAESLKYFLTRPKESQLGAWVSYQSSVISGRKLLEMKLMELKNKFSKGEIPLPSFWGGYRIIPDTFEFWQGGPGRVHDRFMYKLQENGSWTIERLQP